MATEPTGSPSDLPSERSRPVEGLRLRPLPLCSNPAFPLYHEYFEVVYGPLLGPTSVLLARNLARHIAAAGGPVTVCPIEISREVGLRASHDEPVGKGSHLVRCLERLCHHRLLARIGTDVLGIAVEVQPVGPKVLERLPAFAQQRHQDLVREHTRP